MFPQNSTELSFAGIVKWFLAIVSIPFLVNAWNGIVGRNVTVAKSKSGPAEILSESDALRHGLIHGAYALLFLTAAFAVWFFWQRNED